MPTVINNTHRPFDVEVNGGEGRRVEVGESLVIDDEEVAVVAIHVRQPHDRDTITVTTTH